MERVEWSERKRAPRPFLLGEAEPEGAGPAPQWRDRTEDNADSPRGEFRLAGVSGDDVAGDAASRDFAQDAHELRGGDRVKRLKKPRSTIPAGSSARPRAKSS